MDYSYAELLLIGLMQYSCEEMQQINTQQLLEHAIRQQKNERCRYVLH